ncbi:MAG: hypothetical protein ACOY82_00630 [Pseudomonadota bacterium]
MRRDGDRLYVTIAGGDIVRAEAVVLATGHWHPADPLQGAPGYHASPWPAARLQDAVCARWLGDGARDRKRVLVLGTYLNALDAVITLSHRAGRFSEDASGRLRFDGPESFRLVMASRGGSLPRVWGRAPSLRSPRVLTPEALRAIAAEQGFVPLSRCVDLLAREIALEQHGACTLRLPGSGGRPAHRRTGVTTGVLRRRLAADLRAASGCADPPSRYADTREVPWQVALFSALPVLSEFTHALSAEDQCDFDDRLRTAFFHHAMPMTLESARKIEALFASGHLETMALGDSYACVPNPQGVALAYRALDGRQEIQEFTDVVKAHAGPVDIRHHPAPLFQDALRSGIVQPAARGFRDAGSAERIAANRGTEAIVERGRRPALVVGGVEVDPVTREVVAADAGSRGQGDAPIFAMGPLLIGQFLDAHSIGQLIRDSACILERLASMQGSDGSQATKGSVPLGFPTGGW